MYVSNLSSNLYVERKRDEQPQKKFVFECVRGRDVSFRCLCSGFASAAIIEYEPEVPVEIGSGWYLRGDLGVALYTGASATWVDNAGTKWPFTNEDIDYGWLAGVGAGYYFNEKLRGDVTLDYHGKAKFEADAPCVGSPCSTHETHKFSAWTLMLNGYYDIGTWNAITPYIGAGAGMAYLRATDYTTTSGQVFGNKSRVNFAWNVMAGAAFDISDRPQA